MIPSIDALCAIMNDEAQPAEIRLRAADELLTRYLARTTQSQDTASPSQADGRHE